MVPHGRDVAPPPARDPGYAEPPETVLIPRWVDARRDAYVQAALTGLIAGMSLEPRHVSPLLAREIAQAARLLADAAAGPP